MTRFKDLPLFGPDSSPQNTSEKLALIGTAIFWFIFFLCMLIINPAPKKPKFKEVQIVLSSTPIEKKVDKETSASSATAAPPAQKMQTESTPAPVVERAPAKSVEQTPKSAPKKTAPAKNSTAAKTSSSAPKTTPAPAKKSEPIEYAKSVEDLMAEQFANNKKSKKSAEDIFASMDDDYFEDSIENQPKTVTQQASFSGSAGKTAESKSKPITSNNSSSKNTNQKASDSTASSLGKISNAKFYGTSSSEVDTETNVKTTTSSNGKVSMVMENGASRILLDPAKPIINLSESAASTIDGSRKVTITFTVTESGNVPRGEIIITPESILAEIVRKEIRDQISKWRFESASYTSKANFEYKIVKYN